jgi:hypothetical protein
MVNSVCGFVACIALLYFVVSTCILVFILIGSLEPGQPMFMDAKTPSLLGTIKFLLGCAALLAGCIYIRTKIGEKKIWRSFERRRPNLSLHAYAYGAGDLKR